MNHLESQATDEIIGALMETLEEQGFTHDPRDLRNNERQTVYTNGEIAVVLSVEACAPVPLVPPKRLHRQHNGEAA